MRRSRRKAHSFCLQFRQARPARLELPERLERPGPRGQLAQLELREQPAQLGLRE